MQLTWEAITPWKNKFAHPALFLESIYLRLYSYRCLTEKTVELELPMH